MKSSRLFRVSVGVYALLAQGGCLRPIIPASAGPDVDPGITRDQELESLKQAVAWAGADDVTVLSLLGHYSASNRDREAQRYFQARATAHPDRGLFMALEALFRARVAGEVPLLSRVAWVKEAIARLDHAVALDPGVSRVIRALVLAQLPARFGQLQRAHDELKFILDSRDSPVHPERIVLTAAFGLRRAAWQALARVYQSQGRAVESAAALERSGATSLQPGVPLLATPFSVSAADGFRFGPPRVVTPQAGVFVASGHDFADIAFIATGAGVVAVDAGTTPETARRAWLAVSPRLPGQQIRTVILTHGHWDHAGGLAAYQAPGVEVIAHASFPRVLARGAAAGLPYRYFFGDGFRPALVAAARPTRFIAERTALRIGGVDLVLHPTRGGETEDALLVELPATGLLFVGDAFMPYLGAPFMGEGSPDGVLETIATLARLNARRLVHGHAPLTDLYTAEVLPQLATALRELQGQILEGVSGGRAAADMQNAGWLPRSLASAPRAVLPYLAMRENFIARLQRERTGYWQPDGVGLRPHTRAEWGSALDLLAGSDDNRFRKVAEQLLARGNLAMALEIADAGLTRHADSQPLRAVRRRALDRLREKHQATNPFKFIIYSELAGAELRPLEPGATAAKP